MNQCLILMKLNSLNAMQLKFFLRAIRDAACKKFRAAGTRGIKLHMMFTFKRNIANVQKYRASKVSLLESSECPRKDSRLHIAMQNGQQIQ